MAAALVAMVARLSLGKTGMESESFYREISLKAKISPAVSIRAAPPIPGPSRRSARYRLPKSTPVEKKTPGCSPGSRSRSGPHASGNAEACRNVLALSPGSRNASMKRRFGFGMCRVFGPAVFPDASPTWRSTSAPEDPGTIADFQRGYIF